MNTSCLQGEDLARLRAELRAAQHLITRNGEQLRAQVAARQRDSAHRCGLSRSVLARTRGGPTPA